MNQAEHHPSPCPPQPPLWEPVPDDDHGGPLPSRAESPVLLLAAAVLALVGLVLWAVASA